MSFEPLIKLIVTQFISKAHHKAQMTKLVPEFILLFFSYTSRVAQLRRIKKKIVHWRAATGQEH